MDREEQLSWEHRVGRPVAIAAFASAAMLLAAIIILSSTRGDPDADTVGQLANVREHEGTLVLGSALQALATALVAVPLWFLFRAAKFRRPETPAIAKYLAVIAPVAAAGLGLAYGIVITDVAERVGTVLSETDLPAEQQNERAEDEVDASAVPTLRGVAFGAALGHGFAFLLVSLNAMRAGLLSRFMGILGIIVGALIVLPIFGTVPFIQIFWIAALGLLFLDRWPQGGRGPAWDAGEAIPWPTAQDRQAELVAARAEREAEQEEAGDGEPEPEQHPRSKKRKRKRR